MRYRLVLDEVRAMVEWARDDVVARGADLLRPPHDA
jgi:hypothetical protein